MAQKEPTLEIFESEIGSEPCFHWRLRARNGEVVCVSEGYESKSNAKRGAIRAVQLMADATLAEGD